MNKNEWKQNWLSEERAAHIRGWDFSHIDGRYTEEDVYKRQVFKDCAFFV